VKILLIYPYTLEERIDATDAGVVPIGLWILAALLEKDGHDVEVLNWQCMKGEPKQMEFAVREKKPDLVGLSVFNANRWGGIEIARIVKKVDPGIRVVFGGPAPTFLWEHFLTRFPEIDYVVIGEGETSFPALVSQTEEEGDPGNLKGIAYRTEGGVVRTEDAAPVADLDELPDPARFFAFQHLVSSRGCVGKCTYCGSPRWWKRRVRFYSPEYFVSQMETLREQRVSFFYVSDDMFTLNKDHAVAVCREIVRRELDVQWYAISHVNHVDEDVLYWMRRAGCIQISYGVESGSPKIRRSLGRETSDESIERAFRLTVSYGILPRAYFIYGCPGETRETIEETISLMHRIRPLSVIFYILDIFPGTALYEDFLKRTGLTDDIWLNPIEDIMYWQTDPQLSKESVLAFGERLRTAFFGNLHEYAASVELADVPELYVRHADFLSRLGLTFSHGDYSKLEAVKNKQETAELLFRKALKYAPDARAYLGLGMLAQERRDLRESVEMLERGVDRFPDNEELAVCLGVGYMNIGEYAKALQKLLPFSSSERTGPYIAACYKELGQPEKAASYSG
jgi:anaerobic magnesium-protoporphyrin IX monomethyl ester cyclase